MDWVKRPTAEELHRCARIVSGLDRVLMWDNDEVRYFCFYPEFKPGVDAVLINDGAGDYAWGLFGPQGVIFRAFDHESPLSPHRRKPTGPWPGMFDGVPAELLAYFDHPDIDPDDVTLCVYRVPGKPWVETALRKPPKDADGGWWLLTRLHTTARDWLDWAEDYYGCEFVKKAVSQVYKEGRITEELAKKIVKNAEFDEPFDYQRVLPELTSLGLA